LSIVIDRTLKAALEPVAGYVEKGADANASAQISGNVLNEAGRFVGGAIVKLTNPDDPAFGQRSIVTREGEEYRFSGVPPEPYYDVQVSFFDMEASVRQEYADTTKNLELDLSFIVTGLEPDKAFADEAELDVSKPFYPFGQQPQPGSAFYFTSEEVLSKPGAEVRVAVIRTVSPQDEVNPKGDQDLPHKVFWEYWNGRQWAPLAPSSTTPGSLLDLDETEIIDFTVPEDLTRTVVNEQEALWIRARLVSGGFGVKKTVSVGDADISYVIYRPPALSAFRMGYTWQYGPFPAERVLTRNDFQFADRTFEANWPGSTFLPFASVSDTTPALYMGFDRKLPVDRIGLFFDIVEERGVRSGPALVWEYWDGSTWRALSVEDDTADLRLPGILSFIAAPDSQPLMRFDAPLHFLRGRLKEDGPPGEPVFNNIFPNAVWAWQRQTFDDFPLGTSTGLPDQVFNFINFPVLAGERIEVREMTGPRANVEWRILAEELAGGDPNAVRELEEMLGREGEQTEIVKEGRFPYIYRIRLVRDKNKRVSEVWVRWEGRLRLFFSEPDDRHYVIDRAGGRLVFGDGIRGKIPPAGTVILAKEYRAGGGLAGNVPVRAINQLLSAIPGVQLAFNPQAAGGGSDGETLEAFGIRGPLTIRHRGRAATPSDYETLAREASPAVAVARAIANRNTSGQTIPGWVTLLIIPQSREARPQPSFGLRRQVLKYVEERAPADLAEAGHINVTGPDYLPVDVDATIAPVDLSEAGAVERAAREALGEFFHPLRGGPEGRGWELGRDVYLSDVASVLERVAGVDYVEELALLIEGARQGERVPVADDRIVVAGDIRLKLKAAAD
ncbi:MAG: putative baseplate assembly protein, partial [Blastocatellia bacterium]|nr:putative baseplate assembly protein [Blastocatellia bacterium]